MLLCFVSQYFSYKYIFSVHSIILETVTSIVNVKLACTLLNGFSHAFYPHHIYILHGKHGKKEGETRTNVDLGLLARL